MLYESEIDTLIKPLIDRQENINTYVLKQIALAVKDIGTMLPSDVYKLESIYKTGANVKKINKYIAKMSLLQEIEIQKIIKEVAKDAYKDAEIYYNYKDVEYLPYNKNSELQKVVKAIEKQTLGTFKNIDKAQAFMLRDPIDRKKFIPTSISDTYQRYIDLGIQKVVSNVSDYTQSMRQAMKELADSGLRYVRYETEGGRVYTQRLDTAVRRNILDGIRAVNQGVQDLTGEQFRADGKEITVHEYPAPDHAPVQGHQFTNDNFEKMQTEQDFQDIKGTKYKAFRRPIGALNCRHFTFSIIIGYSEPTYTQEQLNEILKRNEKGYTLKSGKHLTMYECTQEQRKMETEIRRFKDEQIVYKESGDIIGASNCDAIISQRMQEYSEFSKACGLTMHTKNIFVKNYKKIQKNT